MSTGATTHRPQFPGDTKSRIVELPRILDRRGNLTFIESRRHIPFAIARAYWLYDVPGGQMRGGHAYRELEEFVVSLSGSFDVVIDEGAGPQHVVLNRSYLGLYIPRLVWRHIENFSTNAVCLILASRHYDPADYIRDYPDFLRAAREPQ
jgi:dTDP-4-dehydrorhamnose 3,5-epimerase-like enzyme